MKALVLAACLLLVACGPTPEPTTLDELPLGATDLTDVGNGWYTFRYGKKCYAYQTLTGYGGFATKTVFEVTCLTPSV